MKWKTAEKAIWRVTVANTQSPALAPDQPFLNNATHIRTTLTIKSKTKPHWSHIGAASYSRLSVFWSEYIYSGWLKEGFACTQRRWRVALLNMGRHECAVLAKWMQIPSAPLVLYATISFLLKKLSPFWKCKDLIFRRVRSKYVQWKVKRKKKWAWRGEKYRVSRGSVSPPPSPAANHPGWALVVYQ